MRRDIGNKTNKEENGLLKRQDELRDICNATPGRSRKGEVKLCPDESTKERKIWGKSSTLTRIRAAPLLFPAGGKASYHWRVKKKEKKKGNQKKTRQKTPQKYQTQKGEGSKGGAAREKEEAGSEMRKSGEEARRGKWGQGVRKMGEWVQLRWVEGGRWWGTS